MSRDTGGLGADDELPAARAKVGLVAEIGNRSAALLASVRLLVAF